MAGMGPPPKPTRARRNSTVATTKLSSSSRAKHVPDWPLRPDVAAATQLVVEQRRVDRLREEINDCTDRRKIGRLERDLDAALAAGDVLEQQISDQAEMERTLWAQLWVTPQATMWEQLAWAREVAHYVRLQIRAELGDLDSAKEARQWSDRLGLNPLALLRLRWEIERTEEAETRGGRRRQQPAAGGVKQPTAAKDPRSVLHAV